MIPASRVCPIFYRVSNPPFKILKIWAGCALNFYRTHPVKNLGYALKKYGCMKYPRFYGVKKVPTFLNQNQGCRLSPWIRGFERRNYSKEETIQGRKLLKNRRFWPRKLFKEGNYSRAETIWGNTVSWSFERIWEF